MGPNAAQLAVRVLTEQDAAAYRDLRLSGLQESPEAFASSYDESKDLPLEALTGDLREELAPLGIFALGAFDRDGALVGMVLFRRELLTKTNHKGWIFDVYVRPSHRGSGAGGQLVKTALEMARELPGLEQVLLSVTATQEPAIRLYRRLGFVSYGREPNSRHVDGRSVDEELMVLKL